MKRYLILALFITSILVLNGCENIDLSKVSDKDLERVANKLIISVV